MGLLLTEAPKAPDFFGQGIIVRLDPDFGYHLNAKSTQKYIQNLVQFPDQEDLNRYFLQFSGRPVTDISVV